MKRIALLLVASAAVCSAPALADEVVVHHPGVTVGSGPDTVVREKEVVREREPRDREKVIIHKDRDPAVVEKKTIIHHDD